jgi:hypothetical protein
MQNYDIDQVLFLTRPQVWFPTLQEKIDTAAENITCIDDWLAFSSEHPEIFEIDDECSSSNSAFMNFGQNASEYEDFSSDSSDSSAEDLKMHNSETIQFEADDHMTTDHFRHSLSLSSPIFIHERGVESWRDLL